MPKSNKKFKKGLESFSKNLLSLKFMQGAKKQVEKVDEETDKSFDSSTNDNFKKNQQYVINPSYQFCERLRFGRFSFKGMNTDIETIMFNQQLEEERIASEKRILPPSDTSSDNEIDDLESDEPNEEEDCLEGLQ